MSDLENKTNDVSKRPKQPLRVITRRLGDTVGHDIPKQHDPYKRIFTDGDYRGAPDYKKYDRATL